MIASKPPNAEANAAWQSLIPQLFIISLILLRKVMEYFQSKHCLPGTMKPATKRVFYCG
jgi:hypothetical protein